MSSERWVSRSRPKCRRYSILTSSISSTESPARVFCTAASSSPQPSTALKMLFAPSLIFFCFSLALSVTFASSFSAIS